MRHVCRLILPILVLSWSAVAAPRLRLSTTAVGPLSIVVGQNGPVQTLEASNAGDGTLSLQVASSVPWLAPTVGAARNCTTQAGACLPINLALNTAQLPKGIITAIVTVSDANAIDAPQSITVTVQMGGGIPDRFDFFSGPNGPTVERTFTTNNSLSTQIQNAPWLTLSLDGSGTFRFSYPYRVRMTPGSLTEGTYSGNLVVSGSGFAPDNKTVPLSLRVTSQPIASAAGRVSLRLVAGSKSTVNVPVANAGLGALTLTPATDSSAAWLTAGTPANGAVPLAVDTTGLNPGFYAATIRLNSNAVNNPLTVAVDLQVVAAGPPRIDVGAVVSNATFESGPVAQGGIAAVFGSQFRAGDPVSAAAVPLPTELGGVRVLVNGVAAPLFYTSAGQINFQIPYETSAGIATVQVERDRTAGNLASVAIAGASPKVIPFFLNGEAYGIAVNQDGTFPWPSTPGLPTRPARTGDALTIYCIGLGPTSPAAVTGTGAPLDPLARVDVKVFLGRVLGGVEIVPLFAGLTPNFVGLYQVNIQIPADAPRGPAVPLILTIGGTPGNTTAIAIE